MCPLASFFASQIFLLNLIHEFAWCFVDIPDYSTSISVVNLFCFLRAHDMATVIVWFKTNPRALSASPCFCGLRNLGVCYQVLDLERSLSCRALLISKLYISFDFC